MLLLGSQCFFVMRKNSVHEVQSVRLKLFRLDFIVPVDIDFSENCVHVLISDWEVDLVLCEEGMQEISQFSSVQVPVLVFVEGHEILVNSFFQMVTYLLEIT